MAQPNNKGSGNALMFDGTDDLVEVSNSSMLNTPNGTIQAWVKYEYPSSDPKMIVIKTSSFATSNGAKFVSITPSDQISWNINTGCGGCFQRIYGPTIQINQWYHITATWGTGGMKLYVNGVLVGTNAYTGSGDYSNESTTIGGWVYYSSQTFDGKIDEVRIWNRALTKAEIREYLTSKLTGDESGLVGYWRFDKGSGNTALDSTPNNNDGTLQ